MCGQFTVVDGGGRFTVFARDLGECGTYFVDEFCGPGFALCALTPIEDALASDDCGALREQRDVEIFAAMGWHLDLDSFVDVSCPTSGEN